MGIKSHEVHVPHYAAMIIFELHHEPQTSEWNVVVEYKNHEYHGPLLEKWRNVSLTTFMKCVTHWI